MTLHSPLIIDYYTDVLCVWAWIAQRRIDELHEQWGDKIVLRHHYLNLFGDTKTRMEKQWEDRGGYSGFSQHVLESAPPYDNAPVNPSIWQDIRPATSANAHLVLKAVESTYSSEASVNLAISLRRSFFVDNQDIGQLAKVLELAELSELDASILKQSIDSGVAIAALMADYQKANELNIKGSPSWIMNNGRQTLFGNVGYRVLNANIKEILKHPEQEASWC